MTGYPPIEDHGLIGDLQTAALVATDGTVDWFCTPRFDSPSVFASLLDAGRGGRFRIAPASDGWVSKQLYLPGTAILITRFLTEEGVGEIVDFMPVIDGAATDRHRLVRLLRVVRGQMRVAIDVEPRFDYGRGTHTTEITEAGVLFHGSDGTELALHVARRANLRPEDRMRVEEDAAGVHAVLTASAGEIGGVVLETAPDGPPREPGRDELLALFEQTREFWRRWVGRSTYRGRWRERVDRSAITLKLLTYRPTGALVAAPTAGLPEQAGGERNWDYRYTWVRDGSLSIHALLGLGYTEEAGAFLNWLSDRVRAPLPADGGAPPLQIMYRIDGSSDLSEEELGHFDGWRGSRPVRVGNGAAGQLQLDIFGEALDSVHLAATHGLPVTHAGWQRVTALLDWLCDAWDQPDDGIWETRGGRQHFTYGRVMSWVAFDRALRLADRHARPADVTRWRAHRDAIYQQVMERAWNQQRQAFVQHYDTSVLDAANLYLPLVGFVDARDPRWHSTLAAMDGELVSDSLVYRYDPAASPDGLRGDEGTFSMCTFWYVDALARSGRLDDAVLTFEKMLTYANHVGLYAEEIGRTGEQLGNFPQAFSHLALITAATTLDQRLER
ncbi:glycoside hydrolase family 15 protein [Jiangella alkaliphila]|uniref:Glucoamylase (Glucan-1,4-alpha-glucosidase), GH15 family n=1 Tax=Jiangella alkaliphila TaxID=419479 RepID=A0A1H2KWU8_9ACTN|nr:glycoside hydrolase family 15 protein [Jiangella alkaliphila]SDU73190.1 Glucoamylase (glucan-1,4-alpha-glucosidase), GH15 family [Jiangella alkaliphila]